MNILRRGKSDDATPAPQAAETPAQAGGATTPGKGRPTPKRRDAEGRRRGPAAPAPQTAKEARALRKNRAGDKGDRKQASAERRAEAALRRERMAAGDERYLLPRDKGPLKAYVRDIVDSRRSLVNFFMPMAVVLLIVLYGGAVFGAQAQIFVTLVMLVMLIVMAVDGFILGRVVNKRAAERFPKHTERPFGLGWYAFSRAMQIRRLRLPKPRVSPGDAI